MFRQCLVMFFSVLSLITMPIASWAQSAKPVLDIKMVFANDGTAKVSEDTHGSPAQDANSNKIEAALIYYAYVMNKLDVAAGKTLINQIQSVVSKVATEQGLVRADLLKENPLLKPLAKAAGGKEITILFSEVPGQGHSMDVKPSDIENVYLTAGVIYLFQDLVQKLPEPGLRLLVLAMGGMNKFYRDGADPSNAANISKAPAYALNLAVDIIQKVAGSKGL